MSLETQLAAWHEMIATRNLSALNTVIHKDAVFLSPVAHTPYAGKEAVIFILSNVIEVFENFTYHRTFINENARSAMLEFSAEVNGKHLKGVDLITFDANGRITHFEVMIRPISGLMALAQTMAPRLAKLDIK